MYTLSSYPRVVDRLLTILPVEEIALCNSINELRGTRASRIDLGAGEDGPEKAREAENG